MAEVMAFDQEHRVRSSISFSMSACDPWTCVASEKDPKPGSAVAEKRLFCRSFHAFGRSSPAVSSLENRLSCHCRHRADLAFPEGEMRLE